MKQEEQSNLPHSFHFPSFPNFRIQTLLHILLFLLVGIGVGVGTGYTLQHFYLQNQKANILQNQKANITKIPTTDSFLKDLVNAVVGVLAWAIRTALTFISLMIASLVFNVFFYLIAAFVAQHRKRILLFTLLGSLVGLCLGILFFQKDIEGGFFFLCYSLCTLLGIVIGYKTGAKRELGKRDSRCGL